MKATRKRFREELSSATSSDPFGPFLQWAETPPSLLIPGKSMTLRIVLSDHFRPFTNSHEEFPLKIDFTFVHVKEENIDQDDANAFFEYDEGVKVRGHDMMSVEVRAKEALSSSQATRVKLTIASHLTCVMDVTRHALLLVTRQPPDLFFKDEGGRDRTMSFTVELRDAEENNKVQLDLPLQVTLCYEGKEMTEVKNQGILRVDKETSNLVFGTAELKVRVEEVSKNHQKQNFVFRVQIHPSVDPQALIAPTWTLPVTILSKRNKRRNKPMVNTNDTHLQHVSSSPLLANSDTLHAASVDAASYLRSDPLAISLPTLTKLRPSADVALALDTVSTWCQHTIRTFVNIEWQHIGFEVNESGDLHLQRPLHRCPACWTYRDSLRPAVHKESCPLMLAKHQYQTQIQNMLTQLTRLAHSSEGDSQHSSAQNDDENGEEIESNYSSEPESKSAFEQPHSKKTTSHDENLKESNNLDTSALDLLSCAHGERNSHSANDDLPSHLPIFHSDSSFARNSFMQMLPLLHPTLSIMPSLNSDALRGMSSGYDVLSRMHSTSHQQQEHEYISTQLVAESEANVTHIHLVPSTIGLPGFDHQARLIGFYCDEVSDGVQFFSLLAFRRKPVEYPTLQSQVLTLTQLFERALQEGSQNVIARSSFTTEKEFREYAVKLLYDKQNNVLGQSKIDS